MVVGVVSGCVRLALGLVLVAACFAVCVGGVFAVPGWRVWAGGCGLAGVGWLWGCGWWSFGCGVFLALGVAGLFWLLGRCLGLEFSRPASWSSWFLVSGLWLGVRLHGRVGGSLGRDGLYVFGRGWLVAPRWSGRVVSCC
ncbi:hypothetical protein GCM10009802_13470 [Streptomyces synnematoformans]|uniref:Uncharacterized protein n=1 Tax=Streptomyces synnematoformans TaxID=415721 RepID=A0ABN2XMX6_9ACTN